MAQICQLNVFLGTVFFVALCLDCLFPGPDLANPVIQAQKRIRPAVLLAFAALFQDFGFHKRPAARIHVDGQLVGDGALARPLAVVDVELNRFIDAKSAHALEATAQLVVTGGLHIRVQAVSHKAKGIEQRAFAHPVLADDHRERGQRITF